MCIICLEFQKYGDLDDAWRMLQAARREPNSIDAEHLKEVEGHLQSAADAQQPPTR